MNETSSTNGFEKKLRGSIVIFLLTLYLLLCLGAFWVSKQDTAPPTIVNLPVATSSRPVNDNMIYGTVDHNHNSAAAFTPPPQQNTHPPENLDVVEPILPEPADNVELP